MQEAGGLAIEQTARHDAIEVLVRRHGEEGNVPGRTSPVELDNPSSRSAPNRGSWRG